MHQSLLDGIAWIGRHRLEIAEGDIEVLEQEDELLSREGPLPRLDLGQPALGNLQQPAMLGWTPGISGLLGRRFSPKR
jgi:hypothetical protein